MAQIVYITNGMASTLHSSFELSRRLTAAGHRISYLSPAEIEPQVSAHGYPFRLLAKDREFRAAAKNDPRPRNPLGWLPWLLRRRRLRRRSIQNDEIESAVRELAPDLLLIDFELHFAVIATARLGIPTLLPIVWFSYFRQPGLPPLHTDLQPGDSPPHQRAIRRAWRRLRIQNAALHWRRRFSRDLIGDLLAPVFYPTNSLPRLKAVARARGYSLRKETEHTHWPRLYTYRNLPVLSFNASELEFPHPHHPNLHYLGPMTERERREATLSDEQRTRWSDFERARASESTPRPLVYCSLGSYWSADRDFLRRVLAVFERRPDWQLVLGLGNKLSAGDLEPVPPNALLLDWAPQLEALKLADAAITHGGITTINECLLFEVPMVVYSTGHVDQNGCAARLAYHRLGVVGDKDRDDVLRLESNLERALTDSELRENVAIMRNALEAYQRNRVAEKFIATFLQTHGRPSP